MLDVATQANETAARKVSIVRVLSVNHRRKDTIGAKIEDTSYRFFLGLLGVLGLVVAILALPNQQHRRPLPIFSDPIRTILEARASSM